MKRKIWLILGVLAVGLLMFYLRTWAPYMAISGKSMEPELRAGDLILIEQISPREVKKGDVIAFEIPTLVREHYNYPLVVAHRVIEIQQRGEGEEIIFKTKGDNTGEDPFIVRTVDLKGKVGTKISYLGLPLLFLQSNQGLISVAVIFLLIGLGTYSPEISQIKRRIQKDVFSPVLQEQQETKQILKEFTAAVAEYGEHLRSHTKAAQDLAKTTGKLSDVVDKLDRKVSKEESNKKAGNL